MFYAYQDAIEYQIVHTNDIIRSSISILTTSRKFLEFARRTHSLPFESDGVTACFLEISSRTLSFFFKNDFLKYISEIFLQKYFYLKYTIYSYLKYLCYIKINSINIFKLNLQCQNWHGTI